MNLNKFKYKGILINFLVVRFESYLWTSSFYPALLSGPFGLVSHVCGEYQHRILSLKSRLHNMFFKTLFSFSGECLGGLSMTPVPVIAMFSIWGLCIVVPYCHGYNNKESDSDYRDYTRHAN